MREIKFRVFWNYDRVIIYDVFHRQNLGNRILMQYTGLKDKNGVEIYEGDVLKGLTSHYGEIIGEVKICNYKDNDGFVHGIHYGWNVNGVPLIDLLEQGFEVIGCVYQNPDLLK